MNFKFFVLDTIDRFPELVSNGPRQRISPQYPGVPEMINDRLITVIDNSLHMTDQGRTALAEMRKTERELPDSETNIRNRNYPRFHYWRRMRHVDG